LDSGEGGLEELKLKLSPQDIRFAILECVVTGDEYTSVKFILISWIGNEVPSGISKAKAAGHRKELVSFLSSSLSIASEFQASAQEELNTKDISSALTKCAATYQDSVTVGETKLKVQLKSRSHADSGDRKKSQLNIVDQDTIRDALLQVHRGEVQWAHITYVEGKKDEVYLKSTGNGLDNLNAELFSNSLSFALVSFDFVETTQTIIKYILLSWVGENVNPLQKARASVHKSELADWVITILPFHSHYQASTHDEFTLEGVLFKLRS